MIKNLLIVLVLLCTPVVAGAAQQTLGTASGTSHLEVRSTINSNATKSNSNFTELYNEKSDKTAVVRYWTDWPTSSPNNVLAINTIVAFDGKLYKATQQVTKTGGTPDPATLTTHFTVVGAGDNLGSATASDVAALFSGSGDCLKSDGTKGDCGTGGGYTNLTQFLTQTNWRVFYSDGSGDVKELALGANGEYLKSNGAGAAPSWATPTGGAHDAVTLGTDADVIFGLSTQQLTLDSQSANTFFAAPNGSAGDPTFRAIADADIPSAIARDSELPTDATITTTDVTTNNAGTTKHGWLLKATAPSSGLRNIVAIDNGETAYKNAALFDATNPSIQAFGDSAAVGSAMVAARRDHKHAMPPAPTTITGNAGTATALASDPTDCSANQYATTIAANGNLTCSQVAYSQLSGTPTLGTAAQYNVGTGANNIPQLNASGELPYTIPQLTSLQTASGISSGATHLGTFTGSTIADSSTMKTAFQALETAVEGKQASDADLTTAAGANSASNSTYFGKDSGGTVGFHALPSGSSFTASSTDTLTNKTLDVEGTGNSITIVDKVWFAAAGCNNTTATSFYDLPTANAPAAACITGTNTQKGVLDFDAATDESGQVNLKLPSDWVGSIDIVYDWFAAATSGSVVWGVQTSCVADAETDDPSWNTASTVTDAAKGTANQTNHASITGVTTTGCAASELLHLKFYRAASNGSDTMTEDARLIGAEVTLRRAQ